jgi:hypothetical protein
MAGPQGEEEADEQRISLRLRVLRVRGDHGGDERGGDERGGGDATVPPHWELWYFINLR